MANYTVSESAQRRTSLVLFFYLPRLERARGDEQNYSFDVSVPRAKILTVRSTKFSKIQSKC